MLRLEHFNVSRGAATTAALRFAMIITTCVTLAPGAEPPLTREGQFWVRVVTGSEPVTPATRLKVTSRGAVTVSGNPQNLLSYALKIKVKAPNKDQAERIARAFSVRSVKSSNNYATLVVQRGLEM